MSHTYSSNVRSACTLARCAAGVGWGDLFVFPTPCLSIGVFPRHHASTMPLNLSLVVALYITHSTPRTLREPLKAIECCRFHEMNTWTLARRTLFTSRARALSLSLSRSLARSLALFQGRIQTICGALLSLSFHPQPPPIPVADVHVFVVYARATRNSNDCPAIPRVNSV